MTSKRKFYRTVVRFEVLTEDDPMPSISLEDLAYETTEGHYSGRFLDNFPDNEELDGPTAAKALIAQGSDPEFFMLDEDGNDLEEE